jgi:hypothetical protein
VALVGLFLHKLLGHKVHLLYSVLLPQLAAAVEPMIRIPDQVAGLVVEAVGLAALLLMVALETLRLFRQAKETTVAGMVLHFHLHILLVEEVAQEQ